MKRLGLLAFALSWLFAASLAHAQAAFDDTSVTVAIGGNSGYAAGITVSAPYTVNSISVHASITSPDNLKFFIFDRTAGTFLYVSNPEPFSGLGFTEKSSLPFAPVTLLPGRDYAIGAAADQFATFSQTDTVSLTQGLVTSVDTFSVVAYEPLAAPSSVDPRRLWLRLNAIPYVPPTVPTLTEWAMVLFGVLLAGGAALIIQRRRLMA